MVLIPTPWKRPDGKVLKVWVDKSIYKDFLAACADADRSSTWKPQRIDSYADRAIRGSTRVSNHAKARAWDFFDKPFPQPVDVWGPKNAPDAAFRAAFKRHGFRLGADYKLRKDFPHVEWTK